MKLYKNTQGKIREDKLISRRNFKCIRDFTIMFHFCNLIYLIQEVS